MNGDCLKHLYLVPRTKNEGKVLTGAVLKAPGFNALICLLVLIIKVICRKCRKSKKKIKVISTPRGNFCYYFGLLWFHGVILVVIQKIMSLSLMCLWGQQETWSTPAIRTGH